MAKPIVGKKGKDPHSSLQSSQSSFHKKGKMKHKKRYSSNNFFGGDSSEDNKDEGDDDDDDHDDDDDPDVGNDNSKGRIGDAIFDDAGDEDSIGRHCQVFCKCALWQSPNLFISLE